MIVVFYGDGMASEFFVSDSMVIESYISCKINNNTKT